MDSPKSSILIFRPIEPQDADGLFPLAQDPEVTQYLTWDATTKEDMAEFYKLERDNFRKGINHSFCVSLNNKTPIGSGSLIGIDKTHNRAAIGYWIGKKYWGKGYGTEIVRSLLDHGFNNLKLHRIYCSVRTENVASMRLLEKVGFEREGLSKKSFWRHGKFHDLYQYAVLGYERSYKND